MFASQIPTVVRNTVVPHSTLSGGRQPVILIGGGGHAKVVADILEGVPSLFPRGYVDARPVEGTWLPHLGTDDRLPELLAQGMTQVHVAIGDNRVRERLFRHVLALGFEAPAIISPFARISARARIGRGVVIMPGAVVNADATVADFAVINTCASVDHDCQIGTAAHIGPGTHLAGNVTVGMRSFLGVGCSVPPGVVIGNDVMVGAGSVVVRPLPDDVVAYGVPATARRSNIKKSS